MNALGVKEAVSALIAKLAVPNNEPVNEPENEPVKEPEVPVPVPNVTICSPLEPDFFIKAKPSCVLRAISPKSSDDVLGLLPGTAVRRNLRNWFDMFSIY